ncbi:MAG TPA: hypothetical protein VJU18_08105, partial [Vicinamibacteria bacterium]|nr:hypothetical protein [Vicinamibacteria bacterium]
MTLRFDRLLFGSLILGLAAGAWAQVPLERPSATAWHPATDSWYVADLGSQTEAGGWLARLDRRDKRAQPRWLAGFRAPRALAAVGDLLYVADSDEVVVVDAPKAAIVARHRIKGARLLAGIAVSAEGEAYVSDMLSNAIHRVEKDGRSSRLRGCEGLEGPAGLFLDGEVLLVASRGPVSDAKTLATKGLGHLDAVNVGTGRVKRIGPSVRGRFESVLKIKGFYLASDSAEGTVTRVQADGGLEIIRRGLRDCGGL